MHRGREEQLFPEKMTCYYGILSGQMKQLIPHIYFNVVDGPRYAAV